jgi:DHA2 family multidrug resistance protein
MSFIDVFYLLTVLFASLALFVMVIRKPPEAAGGGGGGH